MIKKLQEFGLSKNESKIYLALIEFGEITVKEMSKITGIHRSNIYESLQKMAENGLVNAVMKEGKNKEDNEKVILKQEKIIKKYDWKQFNQEKLNTKLNSLSKNLINKNNWNLREEEMSKNIQKSISKKGTVVVLTGCAHLSYFEKAFPKAKFPLRNKNS